MLVCAEHTPCEHGVVECQCFCCWEWPSQCPNTYEGCKHGLPINVSCIHCKIEEYSPISSASLPSDDDDTSPRTAPSVGVEGSEGPQRGLAQDHQRVRDRDFDSTQAVCSQDSYATSDNEQSISPRPYAIRPQRSSELYPQLYASARTSEALRFSFPTPGERGWLDAVLAFNQHQLADYTQGAVQPRADAPGDGPLHPSNDVDTNAERRSPTHDLHDQQHGGSIEGDLHGAKQAGRLHDDVPNSGAVEIQGEIVDGTPVSESRGSCSPRPLRHQQIALLQKQTRDERKKQIIANIFRKRKAQQQSDEASRQNDQEPTATTSTSNQQPNATTPSSSTKKTSQRTRNQKSRDEGDQPPTSSHLTTTTTSTSCTSRRQEEEIPLDQETGSCNSLVAQAQALQRLQQRLNISGASFYIASVSVSKRHISLVTRSSRN